MAIAFDSIPPNLNVPLFWAEVHPAATPADEPNKILIMGHKWPDTRAAPVGPAFGLADINRVYPLSGDDAVELFGPGSLVDTCYRIARMQAPFADIRGLAMDFPPAGVVATGAITVNQDASKNNWGKMDIMIAGQPVSINVAPNDTKATITNKLRNAINNHSTLPCTAIQWRPTWPLPGGTVNPNKTRIIAKMPGDVGNEIRMFTQWPKNERRTLAEKLLTVDHGLTGGNGQPAIIPALAALPDERYDVIIDCFDTASVRTQYGLFMDGISGRWSPYQQLYGHVVNAHNADYATMLDPFAANYNDPHMSILGINGTPDPCWSWAAAFGAVMSLHMEAPPEMSRPLQFLAMKGITTPTQDTWWNIAERNALINAGIATYDVSFDGTVRINRACTTYKLTDAGVVDHSWRDAETLFQAAYFVRSMRAALTAAFPRAALTDEDSGIPGFASPGKIKDLFIHEYKRLEGLGLVENSQLFASALIVERDINDANRVNAFLPPDVVNQLRVCAVVVETHLQLKNSFLIDGADVTDPAQDA
jgi:phage tail sheath gpL-like